MAKLKKAALLNTGYRIRGLPRAHRERVVALANKMIMELHLSEIREALSIIQKDIAEVSGLVRARCRASNAPS